MKQVRRTKPFVPSLLDRLIDEDPATELDPMQSPGQQLARIKESVKRDLENLLNTRLRNIEIDKSWGELKHSIANYGLPDFSQVPADSESDYQAFANVIRDVIHRFEPRFKNVQVTVDSNGASLHRALYVKISAVLLVEPDPVAVVYDSKVNRVERTLKLRELKYG